MSFEKSLFKLGKFCKKNNITTEKQLREYLIEGGYSYWYQICFGSKQFVDIVLAFGREGNKK